MTLAYYFALFGILLTGQVCQAQTEPAPREKSEENPSLEPSTEPSVESQPDPQTTNPDQPLDEVSDDSEFAADDFEGSTLIGKEVFSKESLNNFREQYRWGVFPGIYSSNDVFGFELSALYGFYGAALGFQNGRIKYAELEASVGVISIGAGKSYFEQGKSAFQSTIAIPILPVMPYARRIWTTEIARSEYGFMVKIPYFHFSESDTSWE